MKRVCVYCGSAAGGHPAYARATVALADVLATRGLGIVYGGGRVGLMGVLADAALARGVEVIGVIPRSLDHREVAHDGVTELHVTETMHERKLQMADLAEAFVALPGGFGTLEELAEAVTWTQLGVHDKPVGLLDVRGYWDGLVTQLDHAVTEGFMRPEVRGLLLRDTDPAALLDRLAAWQPLPGPKWLRSEEL